MADTKLTGLAETSVIALDDQLYGVDVSDTTDDAAGSSRKNSVQRLLGLLNHACQGRLTTQSGVPLSTADRTAQGTIYFTPLNTGNKIALYDGTRWILYALTERSLALSVTSGKNYDVFIYDNAGTLTLELSAAWTNDATRADALTTQDGVTVKSGATTRRWLGTIRASGTNTTEDSLVKRFVWNKYNQLPRVLRRLEGTDTWTYGTLATWRQANASASNQVEVVHGEVGTLVDISLDANAEFDNGDGGGNGIGVDSTTVPHADSTGRYNFYDATGAGAINSGTKHTNLKHYPTLGYHYFAWLEYTEAGTVKFIGDYGVDRVQSGLQGTILG